MGTPVKQEANGAATAPTGFSLTFATTKEKAVIPQGAANGAKEEVHRELILGLTGMPLQNMTGELFYCKQLAGR